MGSWKCSESISGCERLNLNTVNVPIQVDIPNVTSTNMVINRKSNKLLF